MKHQEYFYTKPENISENIVEIKGEELKHLSRVLRKKVRDVVNVVDGEGNLYTIVLTEIRKAVARGEIQKKVRFIGESNFRLTLAQAVPKGNRFDLIVEKGTELGVTTFIPLICEHSVVEATPARMNRWKKVAIAAMKQSGRSILPDIKPAQSVKEVIQKTGILSIGLIAHPQGKCKYLSSLIMELIKRKQPIKSMTVLVGPESGFSLEEVNFALENRYKSFTLGPRRLRSETAGIASAAILMELMDSLV